MIPGLVWLRSISETKDLIYIRLESNLIALKVETGEVVWEHELGSIFVFQENFSESMVYIQDQQNNLVAIDKYTGETIWKKPIRVPGNIQNSWIHVIDENIYVQRFFADDSGRDHLLSFDAISGKLNWQTTTRKIGYLAPVIFSDQLFQVRMDDWGKDVYLTVFDIRSGEKVQEIKLIDEVYDHVNLEAIGDKLYVDLISEKDQKRHNVLFIVDLNSGQLLWSFNQDLAFHDLTYKVRDDTVFIGTDENQLLALKQDTGSIKWQINVPAFPTYLLIEQQIVLIFSDTGNISAYDAEDGTMLWSQAMDVYLSIYDVGEFDRSEETVQVHKGILYVAGNTPFIRALDISNGDVLWEWNHTSGYEKIPGAYYELGLFSEESIFVFGRSSQIIKIPNPFP